MDVALLIFKVHFKVESCVRLRQVVDHNLLVAHCVSIVGKSKSGPIRPIKNLLNLRTVVGGLHFPAKDFLTITYANHSQKRIGKCIRLAYFHDLNISAQLELGLREDTRLRSMVRSQRHGALIRVHLAKDQIIVAKVEELD